MPCAPRLNCVPVTREFAFGEQQRASSATTLPSNRLREQHARRAPLRPRGSRSRTGSAVMRSTQREPRLRHRRSGPCSSAGDRGRPAQVAQNCSSGPHRVRRSGVESRNDRRRATDPRSPWPPRSAACALPGHQMHGVRAPLVEQRPEHVRRDSGYPAAWLLRGVPRRRSDLSAAASAGRAPSIIDQRLPRSARGAAAGSTGRRLSSCKRDAVHDALPSLRRCVRCSPACRHAGPCAADQVIPGVQVRRIEADVILARLRHPRRA